MFVFTVFDPILLSFPESVPTNFSDLGPVMHI